MTRWRAAGGVLGPAAFVAAWAVLGARTEGYSPVDDPISRLAAVDASTRVPMTVALLAYALGIGLLAGELRERLARPVAVAAGANVVGTLAIAATPLDSALGGVPHAAAAGLSYTSLGAIPLLAAGPLFRAGHRVAGRTSVIAGAATLAALGMSAFYTEGTGLWQRTGLTIGDLWLMSTAGWLLRRPRSDTGVRSGRGRRGRRGRRWGGPTRAAPR